MYGEPIDDPAGGGRRCRRPAAMTVGVAASPLVPFAFAAAAALATLAGGVVAMRLARSLPTILALTGGVVVGVALFDLIPAALALGVPGGSAAAMAEVAAGFAAYLVLDRVLAAGERSGWRAHLAPASLTVHSFIDGVGIGVAFHASASVGLVVALAVLTHDLADGVNTVGVALAAGSRAGARRWLAANSLMPLLGVAAAQLPAFRAATLAPVLAVFGGVFLYLGAAELIPRSHAAAPRASTTVATVAGLALIWAVIALARL